MDFTLKKYRELLDALNSIEYLYRTFEEFLVAPEEKGTILRHYVDLLPDNSLVFAKIQNKYGIKVHIILDLYQRVGLSV